MKVMLGVALFALTVATRSQATEFETAGEMVDVYTRQHAPLPLRLYIRGIADGVSMYNSLLQTQGQAAFYCPPEKVGLVDAQFVAAMAAFLKRVPTAKSQPPSAVLLFALRDAFPCRTSE